MLKELKEAVLSSIDSLIRDIDAWTSKRVEASLEHNECAYEVAMRELETLIIDAHQELTFIRDYIDKNVKDNTNEVNNS